MLHIRADGGGAAGSLGTLGRHIEASASSACPQIEWHGDFDFGTDNHVLIFAAPDYESAMRVESMAHAVKGVHAEVMPLRPGARR